MKEQPKKETKEQKEIAIKKKAGSTIRLLKASQTDIKSALACIDWYEVDDMDFTEAHSWANSAADKLGYALAIIKALRD